MLGDWADVRAGYFQRRYSALPGPYGTPRRCADYYWGTRPSDFMIDHFRAFAALTGDGAWEPVVAAHYQLVSRIQGVFSPRTGLLPDFVVAKTIAGATPAAAHYLETAHDGAYKSNSCRVPWHLATDYVVSGDPKAKKALAGINHWIREKTGGDPARIVDGYTLEGRALGSLPAMSFAAPFGAAALAGTDQVWLDALWQHIAEGGISGERDDSIKLLCMLVMSGNWFQP
jgi:hypothetical protein